MNNTIKWATHFTTTVFSNSEILTNIIDLEIYFSCRTDDVVIQNIGLERLKYLFNELSNTIQNIRCLNLWSNHLIITF